MTAVEVLGHVDELTDGTVRSVDAAKSLLMGLMSLALLLGAAFITEAAPSPNVAYRRIDVRDTVTGELFPVALWYPTRAAPAPLFLTGSLSVCRLPAMFCRLVTFEMQVANNAPPADGMFGLIVISHGAGGFSLNHRDLAMTLASHGYVVGAPTHPRGKGNDISGVGVWIGRPKQVTMKNQTGVVVELTTSNVGVNFKLAASGVRLTLEQ